MVIESQSLQKDIFSKNIQPLLSFILYNYMDTEVGKENMEGSLMETQEPQGEQNGNNNEETTVAEITSTQGYGPSNQLEQTLAIIKPDAIDKADEIISVIHREGFAVLQV